VIGLTGTPLDKSMLDLFNVYKVIDLGASLGPNFFAYRNKYFREAWHNWVPKDGCKDKILERLAPVTIAFDRKECFDLPDLQEDVKVITPTQEFLDIQDSIIGGKPIKINGKEYVSEKIDPLDGSCKWDLSSKLRELPGGFLYFKEKDSNVAERLKSNPKLDALLDIIDDSHGKIIVYHSFVEAAGFVEERLRKHKVKFVPVRGGQKPADRQNAIKRFMTDTSVRVMLAHPVCASEGFDGSAANTVLFYDVIGSPRVRDQCVGRIYRKGQTRSCLVLELQLAKSIDSRIAANRKRDVSMVETVMDFLRDRKVNKDG
jgi:SNF2 family DNA or RNA helicase